MRRSLPLLLSPYFFHGAVHPGLVTPSSHVTPAVAQHVPPPKVKLQAFLTKDTCYGFTLGESTFRRRSRGEGPTNYLPTLSPSRPPQNRVAATTTFLASPHLRYLTLGLNTHFYLNSFSWFLCQNNYNILKGWCSRILSPNNTIIIV